MKKLSSCFVAASLAVVAILCGCGNGASSSATTSQTEGLPAKFDLRDKGLVTSVKNQTPWGASWAYGALASAESSALSLEGSTYEQNPIDFSEEHLMTFALSPVSELDNATQAGEGLYMLGGNALGATALDGDAAGGNAPKTIFDLDGSVRFADAVLASGCGPRLQKSYDAGNGPSTLATGVMDSSGRGTFEGYTLRDANALPSVAKRGERTPEAPSGVWEGRSEEGERAIKDELQKGHAVAAMVYSKDAADSAGSNINLQTWSLYNSDPKATPNHSVCIVGWDDDYAKENFTRDTSAGNEVGGGAASSSSAAGSATASGSASSSSDEGSSATASSSANDDSQASNTTPPGNGAWIVKDSRGSEASADKGDETAAANGTTALSKDETSSSSANNDALATSDSSSSAAKDNKVASDGAWGITDEEGKHTGYYYVSYYDTSLDAAETFVLDNDFAAGDFDALQYDYLCAADSWQKTSSEVLCAANVFTVKHDGELRSVATRTQCNNATVEFTVRKVARRSTNPEEGPTLAKFSQTFAYAGFHRVDLPEAADLKSGDYISVMTTTTANDNTGAQTYSVSAARCVSLSALEQESLTGESPADTSGASLIYGKGVVNAGESFIKRGDEWMDWLDYLGSDEFAQDVRSDGNGSAATSADSTTTLDNQDVGLGTNTSNMTYDNFCIKAYVVPTDGVGNVRNMKQDNTAVAQADGSSATWQGGTDASWQGGYGDLY